MPEVKRRAQAGSELQSIFVQHIEDSITVKDYTQPCYCYSKHFMSREQEWEKLFVDVQIVAY